MTRCSALWVAGLAVLIAAAAPANAQPTLPELPELADPPETPRWRDFSWDQAERDQASAFDAAMARGDRHAIRASELLRPDFGNAGLTEEEQVRAAAEAYEQAAAIDPTSPEPHFRAAAVINAHLISNRSSIDPPTARRAIAHWREFERLAPRDPRLDDILFERAIAYTRLEKEADLRAAIADYQRLNQISDLSTVTPSAAATRIANQAEVHMMLGELDTAIALYERALRSASEFSQVLGLAVALDRDHQGTKARELLRPYATPAAIADYVRKVQLNAIFYVPAAEVYYYYGLLAEVSDQPEQAANAYRAFLLSGANSRYAERARENLAAQEKAAKKPHPKPKAPRGG